VFVVFDWPSERVLPNLILDLNEKARRSRVASYHLARFLQTAPSGSRICLLGQSDGGRIVLTTLHLLSGAPLAAFWSEPEVQLSSGRTDLRLRAVVLDAAAGHHWLNPGERLHQALPVCESLLNLRNCGDYALAG
jgi:esterase/lipase superfamily enzyme